MYSQLNSHVNCNGNLGSLFNITIGTRQGCNLSPSLFNLYINDLPSLLEKAQCDPVTLNTIKINTFMYVDDTLLLSKSKAGLEKALRLMEIYCQKWQLKINTDKTKIMIFNKRPKHIDFKFNGQALETVQCYNYLGLKISNSGSFTAAIKELSSKASRAYQSLRNALFGLDIPPKSYMKLFDILIKPIALSIWMRSMGSFWSQNPEHDRYFKYIIVSQQKSV